MSSDQLIFSQFLVIRAATLEYPDIEEILTHQVAAMLAEPETYQHDGLSLETAIEATAILPQSTPTTIRKTRVYALPTTALLSHVLYAGEPI